MRAGLISSLVFNCVLLVAAIYLGQRAGTFDAFQDSGRRAPSTPGHGPEPSSTVPDPDTRDRQHLRHLYAGLLSAGLDEIEAKTALVAHLYANTERPPREYWKSQRLRVERELMAEHRNSAAMYAVLKELFGIEAGAASSILQPFFPLQQEFPFLTAEKQLRVQEVLIAHRGSQSGTAVQSRETPEQRRASLLNGLRAVLSKDEMFEYELRRSPVAERLRETGFDFTEEEFRKVFAVLASADHSKIPQAMPAPASWSGPGLPPEADSIAKVLGDERFRQYVKLQDPTYQLLRKTSVALDLAPTTADAAYEVIRRAAEKANDLGAKKPVLSPAARGQIADLLLARDRELRQLLGEPAFGVVRAGIGRDEFMSGWGARPPNAPIVNRGFQ